LSKSDAEYAMRFFVDLAEETPARVLHVDDEPSILKATKQCLEIEGAFQVDSALSVEEARKKMKKKAYDVIVSDYMMTGQNGLDFLSGLRAGGNTIPFIVFTGKGREEVAAKALNLGADQYLNKIGDPETVYLELAHGIRKAMQRKRASKRIRESEEKFRKIFESASDAMIYLDKTGRILGVNRKTVEVYGGPEKELVGKHFTKLGMLSRADIPKLVKAFARGLSGKHPILNICIRNKRGQEVSLECQGSLMRMSGKTTLLVIARDVTRRRQAEEGLKKSEEKYKDLLEATPIGICNLDMRGKITYANRAFEQLTGYSRDEILGRSALNLARQALRLSDEQLKPIITRIRNRLSGRKKSLPMTLLLRRKDGALRWVEAESKLIRKLGLPAGLQAILRDITERKQTEERLRESEERFRSIVENSHGGIGIVDDNFKIRYVNDQVSRILGYSKKELIGQDFRKLLPGESRSLVQDRYLRRQNGEDIPPQYEFELIRKDGRKIAVEMKAAIIQDSQGRVQTVAEILDVTDRRKAFEALRESEEKFRNLAEQLPNMVFINNKGRVVYANNKCREVMGYTEEEFYSPDFDFLNLVAPQSVDMVTSAFKKHTKGEEISPYEYTLVTKEGKRIEAIITTKLVKYDGDTAILGIVTDITERKRVETELRSSEERLSLLFQYAPDAYYLSDLKGTFVDGNRAAERLTGYDREELIGKSFLKLNLLSRREIPRAAKLLATNALEKPTGPDEFTLNQKDGTHISVEIRTFPINVKGKTLVLGIARDITERNEKEREIRESREKFKQLFMGNPEAAVYVGSDFCIMDVNPRFQEMFGYSPDEIIGRHINDVVVPEKKLTEAEALDKKANKGYVYQDTIRKRKDGSLVPVSISAAPITIEDRLEGFVGVYKDISQLKKAEKEVKDTLEKLRVVGRLVRHDVRNKLSAVTLNCFLAKKKLAEDHEALEHLGDIESSVWQAAEIFGFASTYEKLGIEELDYIDVERSFEEAASLLPRLPANVRNECGGLAVLADSLLQQLFYNLIQNSLNHGERVTEIRIRYEEMGKDVLRLIYEDDGIGIPEAEKERIFEEGYGRGTGYGLYLIRKICEVYGWTIQETGKHGKGAQFTITVPRMSDNRRMNYRLNRRRGH